MRLMPSDGPATAQEAIDTVGVWASTMLVMTTDGVESVAAALSSAAASPARAMPAVKGSPVKSTAARDVASGAWQPESRLNPGADRSAQSGWDALTASAAEASPDRLGPAVPRHAVAASLPLDGGQHDGDDSPSVHAPVALGPAVRSHHKIEVLTVCPSKPLESEKPHH